MTGDNSSQPSPQPKPTTAPVKKEKKPKVPKKPIILFWGKVKMSRKWRNIFILAFIFSIFFFRDSYQPALLFMRKYILVELISLAVIMFAVFMFKRAEKPLRRGVIITLTLLFFVGCYLLRTWYEYGQELYTFNHLNIEQIHKLPLTQQERIQPQNNIRTAAYEAVSETQEVSTPHLVRVDSINMWTMAIQPAHKYAFQRYFDNIHEIFAVSSTAPFPSFTNERRIQDTFSIGESLMMSRNTYNACVKGFNLLQLFSYEPDQVYFMRDDNHNMVEVVSLIKWKGFLFPYPVFGGVMVFHKGKHTLSQALKRMTIGIGTYICPEETMKHAYLRGQNIMSEKVTRTYAKTFKFLAGPWDPMPNNRKSAVKIPDLEADQNEQPFVTDFNFTGTASTATGQTDPGNGLYHYFGLEPLSTEHTGLSISLFIPADGHSKLYYYNHGIAKEGLAGVSAMPAKVKGSDIHADWSVNAPVEFRPFIRDFDGKRRFFWLCTVVVLREEGKQFDASAIPRMVVVDASGKTVVWLDSSKPSTWDSDIVEQMSEAWQANNTTMPIKN